MGVVNNFLGVESAACSGEVGGARTKCVFGVKRRAVRGPGYRFLVVGCREGCGMLS